MEHDVIVVGTRVAGAPTALLLARRGYRVLAVDRATFPSDTLSTHVLHAPGVAALRRWGLLDALVATGCPPILGYTFDFGPTVESRGDGMACDVQGRWYVSTQAGVRVYDPNGRPIGLILAPTSAAVTSCALAGDRLYALSQGKIFRRQVNAK